MLFFIWLIAEVFLFFRFVDSFGWLNTLGGYFFPSMLGIFLTVTSSRLALVNLQSTLLKGQLPQSAILNSAAIFVGGLLLIPPTFTTRVFGVILLLPGIRHLFLFWFKIFAAKKIAQGSQKFFKFGNAGGFQFYSYTSDQTSPGQASERDVTPAGQDVLDVKPLAVTHEEKPESSGQSEYKDS